MGALGLYQRWLRGRAPGLRGGRFPLSATSPMWGSLSNVGSASLVPRRTESSRQQILEAGAYARKPKSVGDDGKVGWKRMCYERRLWLPS